MRSLNYGSQFHCVLTCCNVCVIHFDWPIVYYLRPPSDAKTVVFSFTQHHAVDQFLQDNFTRLLAILLTSPTTPTCRNPVHTQFKIPTMTDLLSTRGYNIKRSLNVLNRTFHTFAKSDHLPEYDYAKVVDPPTGIASDIKTWRLRYKNSIEDQPLNGQLEAIERLQPALIVRNKCDSAVSVTIELALEMFRGTSVSVEWLVLVPKPRVLFAIEGDPFHLCQHSVLLINDTTEKIEYVADFTIEQFGHDASEWFQRRDTYIKYYCATTSSRYLTNYEVVERKKNIAEFEYWGGAINAARNLLGCFDWDAFWKGNDFYCSLIENHLVQAAENFAKQVKKQTEDR
jgi:hypothetical protein